MFTVSFRDSTGSETLYQATAVRRITQQAEKRMPGTEQAGVYIDLIDGGKVSFGECKQCSTEDVCNPAIFVMNEAGKTVARYEL